MFFATSIAITLIRVRKFSQRLIGQGYHNIDKENWPTYYCLTVPALIVQKAMVMEN